MGLNFEFPWGSKKSLNEQEVMGLVDMNRSEESKEQDWRRGVRSAVIGRYLSRELMVLSPLPPLRYGLGDSACAYD
jgi:hypothetical protein